MRYAADMISRCRLRSVKASEALYRSGEPAGSTATNSLPCVALNSGWSDGPALSRPCEGPLPTQTVTQACSSPPSSTLCGLAATSSASQQRLAATWLSLGASPVSACSVQPPPRFSPFRSFVVSAAASELCTGITRGLESAAEVVEAEEAARMVLVDPVSRMMASQGMPLGLSLRQPKPISAAGVIASEGGSSNSGHRTDGRVEQQGMEGRENEVDLSEPPPAEPAYRMEAFSDMLMATAAAARLGSKGGGNFSSGGSSGDDGFTAGVQRVGPSLEDSWGTTRESPADIARRIVESNLDAEADARGGVSAGATWGDTEENDGGPELPLALSPSEEKYASLEAMSAEIKKLDEVFEVLASVPWLDEDVLSQKELKGIAQVGLLGTLEEVGFNIRHQLLRIWSGERGAELAAGPGLEFRDQAALLAILYHTQQIEDSHGSPLKGYLSKPPTQL